jgi:hypothetical protein
MGIELKQFDGASVTPKDDAVLYDRVFDESGILAGCGVTHLGGNQLQVAAGRGIAKGHTFVVTQETINATVSDSGTKRGRLIIQIDTSNPTTPISFVTQMAAELPALTQEDITDDGNVYELPLVEYDISEVAISNVEDVSNQIDAVTAKKIADGIVTTAKLGTITEITMATGDKIRYDNSDNTFRLAVSGCTEVQLCPCVQGTNPVAPSGTYPKGTVYFITD